MKKGFVISWYYPPGNSSEGLVTFKLLKNSKYNYDVWTRANQQQSVWDRKSDESKLVADNVEVIKCDCKNMKDWVKEGLKYFVDHREEYDFIMSRSMPVESHELAVKIHEKYPDLKWIASFGDPIIDTPYIDDITMGGKSNPFSMKGYLGREDLSVLRASKVFLSPVRQAKKYLWKHDKRDGEKTAKYFKKVNDATLKGANILIYNNNYQFEHAFERQEYKVYKNKGLVLAHSFDPDMYPVDVKNTRNKKLSFIYVGHLDETRNASSLLKAIYHLSKKDQQLKEKIEFCFYGHLGRRDKMYILDKKLTDVIKLNGDVKYLESLKIIKEADWAILIDANFTSLVDNCIYLPAKLIDYMGARTKVFSISHVRGAGADIIHDVGGGKVVTHSPDDIYLYLSKIIFEGYEPPKYDEKKVMRFSANNLAKELDKSIAGLLRES